MLVRIIDLFCGVGGLTRGLQDADLEVVLGIDIEEKCRYAYEENSNSKFLNIDIKDVNRDLLQTHYGDSEYTVLVGCAPCQPFSKYANTASQEKRLEKWFLLDEFKRLIRECTPNIVSMENVPELIRQDIFEDFKQELIDLGYNVTYDLLYCPDFGIPQSRTRLVLLASNLGPIELPLPTHSKEEYVTVRQAIGHLPQIKAGEYDAADHVHYASKLSALNLDRIKASSPGGTWQDWDESLIADCHKKTTGQSYKNVYGRMEWDKVSPTITTQFNGFGNGRFGHPNQDRGLSLREGAILQSFPDDYKFIVDGELPVIRHLATQIGNAVPVKLGKVIGMQIKNHIEDYKNE